MITEDYVSFKTAKLLKEKGFDGPCYKVWESHGDWQTLVGASWFVEGETVVNRELVDAAAKRYAYEYSLNNNVEGYLAPTLQMAMKWLREGYKLEIFPYHNYDNSKWWYEIIKYPNSVAEYECGKDKELDTYEQSCEAAIKYCLENLI